MMILLCMMHHASRAGIKGGGLAWENLNEIGAYAGGRYVKVGDTTKDALKSVHLLFVSEFCFKV